MKTIRVGKRLRCGCCGDGFSSWDGYTDQDQDKGYGICLTCQFDIAATEKVEAQKLIDCLKAGLNKANVIKLESYDFDVQKAIALEALSEGHIKLSFHATSKNYMK